jgi:peptidoglycan/xylan/chitin deacetylase (PgdA/CDA1 family)
MTLHATARGVLRSLRDRVATVGTDGRLARLPGPELLILTYHRVLPRSHEDWATEQPGMLVTPATLAMHIRVLRDHFEFIDLEEWVRRCEAGDRLPRLACAFTFDDGWRDNFDHAFPLLQQHGVPATIFVVTDLVGTRYAFWPNRLARSLGALKRPEELTSWPHHLSQALESAGVRDSLVARGVVSSDAIDRAIEGCKVLSDGELHSLLDSVPQGISPAGRDLLDWDEMAAMQASGLVRFGSHTRRHTRLAAGTDPQQLKDEVLGSADVLEQRLGRKPTMFCYPNGDYDDAAVEVVAGAYRAAVTTDSGWNTPATPRPLLRRVGVHEDVTSTPQGLLRRIERAYSTGPGLASAPVSAS